VGAFLKDNDGDELLDEDDAGDGVLRCDGCCACCDGAGAFG